jgi:hypothetical protein
MKSTSDFFEKACCELELFKMHGMCFVQSVCSTSPMLTRIQSLILDELLLSILSSNILTQMSYANCTLFVSVVIMRKVCASFVPLKPTLTFLYGFSHAFVLQVAALKTPASRVLVQCIAAIATQHPKV